MALAPEQFCTFIDEAAAADAPRRTGGSTGVRRPIRLLCCGGEDHRLRIPFLLALRDRGFEVAAVSTGDPEPFVDARIPHRSWRFERRAVFGDLAAMRELANQVAAFAPDVVQSFDTKPNILTPFALRNSVPVIRTVNGMGWTFSSETLLARSLRPAYCALQWVASRQTAATVFQNASDKSWFEKRRLVPRARSRLIRSSGISVAAFEEARRRGAPASELRRRFGFGDEDIVMMVSRLTREKGVGTLLAAAALVRDSWPNVRFVLVGPWDDNRASAVDRARIEQLAPHVSVLGAQPNIPALLRLANIFVLPTEYREGVPRVLLEAGLAQLPIITTNMPGCTDVVIDGWNGLVAQPRDPSGLAARILQLLRDRRRAQAMGERSRERVIREFELEIVVDQYEALYREAALTHSNIVSSDGVQGELCA